MLPHVVVMGVSGCGKSTVGRQLAQLLGTDFLEGDELHSGQNVARMAAGIALTDEDRQGWLETLAGRLAEARAQGRGLVISCSALKRSYRDILRSGAPDLLLIHLRGDYDLLATRMASRAGHYMPSSLLDSQFATLEPPDAEENALTLDVEQAPNLILNAIIERLRD
jgi:gluconokinase